jgi:hypothetical protein
MAVLRACTALFFTGCCVLAQATNTTTLVIPAASDTSLFSDSENSDGAGSHLWVGQTNGGWNMRALVRFDLSAVPPDQQVVAARLRIFMSMTISPGREIVVRRLGNAWGEGTSFAGSGTGAPASANDATWDFRVYGSRVRWATPGGDFVEGAPSAVTTVGVRGATYTWQGPGLVADVQHWRTFPAENHGWILIGDETERSAMRFNSRGEFGGPVLELDLIPASANVPIPMGWLLIGGAALLGSALMRRR